DANRTRRVGDEVITKQFRQYQSLKESLKQNPIDFTPVEIEVDYTLPPAFIFDIDGTLAHKGDRSPYDWMKVGLDSLDVPTRYMATSIDNTNEAFKNEGKVIICTGRDGVCLDETEKWLIAHKIPYDAIYIRPKGDMRPDWVVKEEMWREISKNYHIIGMFDDREQVVNRARALGFKVFQCEYHNF
ncbi:MAG: hypothetical protein PQJ49_01700, partial [Sphaerochaetaceae bacterium]|nr:hypothetical protein [Sphaerochaetaceae bacterium]